MTKKRSAETRTGEPVYLNETYKVEGGWESWVLHPAKGYAVLVFIPEGD